MRSLPCSIDLAQSFDSSAARQPRLVRQYRRSHVQLRKQDAQHPDRQRGGAGPPPSTAASAAAAAAGADASAAPAAAARRQFRACSGAGAAAPRYRRPATRSRATRPIDLGHLRATSTFNDFYALAEDRGEWPWPRHRLPQSQYTKLAENRDLRADGPRSLGRHILTLKRDGRCDNEFVTSAGETRWEAKRFVIELTDARVEYGEETFGPASR